MLLLFLTPAQVEAKERHADDIRKDVELASIEADKILADQVELDLRVKVRGWACRRACVLAFGWEEGRAGVSWGKDLADQVELDLGMKVGGCRLPYPACCLRYVGTYVVWGRLQNLLRHCPYLVLRHGIPPHTDKLHS